MAERQRDFTETKKQTNREVFFDSTTLSNWMVVRVVLVAFLSWYLASFLINILISLQSLVFLLILSVFFAYLLNPLVEYVCVLFKSRGMGRYMPRTLAIAIVYLWFFTVIGFLISSLVPRVTEQARKLALNIPIYVESIRQEIQKLNERYENYKIPENIQAEINKKVNAIGVDLAQSITTFLGDTAISIASYLPWMILIPIFSFFFLKDASSFRILVLRSFPSGRWRDRIEAVMEDINKTLSAYVRAQLVSCFLIGTACTIGFYIFGVSYALLLGILAGIFEFVPLIGPLAIGIIATLVAGVTDSFQTAISVAVFLVFLRIIHDYVTYPRIMRGRIHLPPLIIILSVLMGEKLAGVVGVFLSIPAAALIFVVYKHVLEHSGKTSFFTEALTEIEEKDTKILEEKS